MRTVHVGENRTLIMSPQRVPFLAIRNALQSLMQLKLQQPCNQCKEKTCFPAQTHLGSQQETTPRDVVEDFCKHGPPHPVTMKLIIIIVLKNSTWQ